MRRLFAQNGKVTQRPSRLVDNTYVSDDETIPDDFADSPATAPAPVRGIVIDGRYLLGPAIASGGMGTVYRARHIRLGYAVALKLSDTVGAHLDARVLREAQLSAQLDDPGIVRVLDSGRHEGSPYIAMELLAGRDLEQLVEDRGPLPVYGACTIVHDVAQTCARMHAAGIIHRDLKPANVFLPNGGHVKVIDFGLAKSDSMPSLTRTGARMGTPSFMAPEQVEDSKNANAAADCYALGGLALYALTGQPPHPAPSMVEQLTQALVGDPPPLADLRPDAPSWLVDLVLSALHKDPAQRPTAAAFATCLEERARA